MTIARKPVKQLAQEELEALVKEFDDVRRAFAAAKEKEKALRGKLLAQLSLRSPDGSKPTKTGGESNNWVLGPWVIHVLRTSSRTPDVKRLQALLKEKWLEYTKEIERNVVRIRRVGGPEGDLEADINGPDA